MKDMIPLLYRNGNQYLHRESADYRIHVKRKIYAYRVFIQAGVISQGLLQIYGNDIERKITRVRRGVGDSRVGMVVLSDVDVLAEMHHRYC